MVRTLIKQYSVINVSVFYLEKAFASLTGSNPVVLTGGVVPAHSTAALIATFQLGRQASVRLLGTIEAARLLHRHGGKVHCGWVVMGQSKGILLS